MRTTEDVRVDSTGVRRAPALGGRASGLWFAAPAVVVLVTGWIERWTADDALITFRVAQQIQAGYGPVFNVGERVEASTSPLWTWLLAALDLITGPLEITWVAVASGLACSVVAVSIATATSLRLHARLGGEGALLPGGLLVVLAVPAFWQYYTSGLETGLTFLWCAGAWAALASVCVGGRPLSSRRAVAASFLWGIGTLVRPELAIVTVVFVAASIWYLRTWAHAVRLVVLASLPGLAYEVFRAGYYGLLVPNTALAKEASLARWGQGVTYLADLVLVYQLWLPLGLLSWVVVRRLRRAHDRAEQVVLIAPLLAGGLLGLYVVRLGGDFMHARMLLPALLLLLLPVWTWQAESSRSALPVVLVLGIWGVGCTAFLRVPYTSASWHYVVDERGEWVRLSGTQHPVTIADHLRTALAMTAKAKEAVASNLPVLIYRLHDKNLLNVEETALPPGSRPVAIVDLLGAGGYAVPLDYRVVDQRALADPIASHQRLTSRGQPGHEKFLELPWALALFDGVTIPAAADAAQVDDARAALACGDLARLRVAVSSPLTWDRFWVNLRDSATQTTFRFDAHSDGARSHLCAITPAD